MEMDIIVQKYKLLLVSIEEIGLCRQKNDLSKCWSELRPLKRIQRLLVDLNPPTGQNGFFRPTREASKMDCTDFSALLERLRKWTARIFLPSSNVFKSGLAALF
ncbi:hypothetical protein TNCV_4300381 [Trichonephila clavipes]|nr:hypothetical protein TNCV_4300381 [Trichonephila clavipes]